MKEKKYTKYIGVFLEPDVDKALRQWAREEYIPVAFIVRKLICNAVKEREASMQNGD